MSVRRWLVLGVVVLLVAAAGLRLALPELIRLAVVARVQAITGRAVSLDAVDVALLRGRVALRGFRMADRAAEPEPFAEFDRLDLHLRLPALLRGHLWLRELVLHDPTVRVIRYPGDEFNLSDLVRQSGEASRVLEVTVDRFVVVNGTTTLEDRALPEPRTWRSEQMAVEAHGLSSRPQYGTAVASSVTGGAPVSVRVERLRLYPIDLEATVTIDGLDLATGSRLPSPRHAGDPRPGPREHVGAREPGRARGPASRRHRARRGRPADPARRRGAGSGADADGGARRAPLRS